MDFRQLKSFAAVVEYRSFSKAAEKLHSAQPTISTHIRQLEEELNTRLILRTTKSIEVTPRGWDAYQYATKILDLRDRIMESCSSTSRSIIRLGASTIPAAYILPDVLSKYAATHPDTYFVTNQLHSREVIDGVLDGRYDVGLTGICVEQDGLICIPFCKNRLVLITPVTEQYLNMQKQIHPPIEKLLKEPIVLREIGSKKSANRFLESLGIQEDDLNVVARVNDQETVKNMVTKGMGVSLISHIAARDLVRERRLLQFELPGYDTHRELYLVYRSRFGAEPQVEEFVKFMQNYEVR